jgi:hypothetical protein
MSEDVLTTQSCADALNRAYGKRAISRQRIHRDIDAGRLQVLKIPAVGSRARALIRVEWADFVKYCQVYHSEIANDLSRNGLFHVK